MNALWSLMVPLAQKAPNPEDVKPGWLGFAVFLLETRVGSRAVRTRSELLEHAPEE